MVHFLFQAIVSLLQLKLALQIKSELVTDACLSCLLQNPGMDFSNAEITGNYQSGGPTLPDS